MTIVRWEPVRELSSLQTEMNRLFSNVFDSPGGGSGNLVQRWVPAMDLLETDDHFVLRADLPGVSQEDVSIELEDNLLTISGERRADHEDRREGYYRVERAFGTFSRSLALPRGVDPEAVNAQFNHGVLEVRIAKPERRKSRKITIAAAGEEPATIEGPVA